MYREGIKWAAAEVVAGRLPWNGHKAAEVLKAVGLHVSGDPINRVAKSAETDGDDPIIGSPNKAGGTFHFPVEAREKLFRWAAALRALGIRVGRSLVLGSVKFLVKGSNLEETFSDLEAARRWYFSWKKSIGVKEGKVKRIEISRKKWCTAKNIKQYATCIACPIVLLFMVCYSLVTVDLLFCRWYAELGKAMVQLGLATMNSDFDETKENDIYFMITREAADRIFSWDQVGWNVALSEETAGNDTTCRIGEEDTGEVN